MFSKSKNGKNNYSHKTFHPLVGRFHQLPWTQPQHFLWQCFCSHSKSVMFFEVAGHIYVTCRISTFIAVDDLWPPPFLIQMASRIQQESSWSAVVDWSTETDEIFRPEDETSYVSNNFWTWKTWFKIFVLPVLMNLFSEWRCHVMSTCQAKLVVQGPQSIFVFLGMSVT